MARKFRFNISGKPYTVEVGDLSRSPIVVIVNGELVEVEVEAEAFPAERVRPVVKAAPSPPMPEVRPQVRPEPRMVAPAPPPLVEGIPGAIIAPMPGRVVAIKVKVGDKISYGDEVCTLEAMKMQQGIKATQGGTVKNIKVSEGQQVAYGHVLVELEQ